MFDPAVLSHLANSHQDLFRELSEIEALLNQRFTGMEEAVQALVLAVAAGEPLLLIGPPGAAKSRLIRAFCGIIGLLSEDEPQQPHDRYFEYLLTPFTEPGELFGFYDIARVIDEKKMSRIDAGMMQNAEVVYLDEIFNGSSAILNAILSFLNERIFHDHGVRRQVNMECLFAATNYVPDTPELKAVFDRFVLRCHVHNAPAEPDAIGSLLDKGWRETYGTHQDGLFDGLLERLKQFRANLKQVTDQGKLAPKTNHPFYRKLAQQIQHARQYELSEMSNRRLVKMTYIMLIHCLYHAAITGETQAAIGSDQLKLLPRFFLDRFDESLTHKMILAAES